jgi:hypothetical protein
LRAEAADVASCPVADIQFDAINVRYRVPAQPVYATRALNLSAGVSNPKVLRGRSLSWQPEADSLLALDEIIAIQ